DKTGSNYVLQLSGSTFNLPAALPNVTLSADKLQATIPAADVHSWTFLLDDMDDSLIVGTGSLDSFAPVTMNGGDGNDSLTVNDSTDTTANAYSISTTTIVRNPGGVTVEFSAAEHVSLTGGTGNDSINVTSTAVATPVTVSGGAGNDTVTVGSNGNSLDG